MHTVSVPYIELPAQLRRAVSQLCKATCDEKKCTPTDQHRPYADSKHIPTIVIISKDMHMEFTKNMAATDFHVLTSSKEITMKSFGHLHDQAGTDVELITVTFHEPVIVSESIISTLFCALGRFALTFPNLDTVIIHIPQSPKTIDFKIHVRAMAAVCSGALKVIVSSASLDNIDSQGKGAATADTELFRLSKGVVTGPFSPPASLARATNLSTDVKKMKGVGGLGNDVQVKTNQNKEGHEEWVLVSEHLVEEDHGEEDEWTVVADEAFAMRRH